MSGRFNIVGTPLTGVLLLERKPIGDERGYLERLYCAHDLAEPMGERRVVQINHTLTEKAGTVRGLHFQQPPHAETKLLTCLAGEVFDVAVDLRRGSNTYLQWHGVVLSAANHRSVLIPEGFAHGFQTLTNACEMLYLHTALYDPSAERGIDPRDPKIDIRWPKPILSLSARDASLPTSDGFEGIVL